MIDQRLVKRKIELIREDLELLRKLEGQTLDELAKDTYKRNDTQHPLQKISARPQYLVG